MAAEGDDHEQMLSKRLFEAIRINSIEEVKICISQGVDLKLLNESHSEEYIYENHVCPLAFACCQGHELIMEELLKAGAEPDQVSGRWHSWPAMNMAAYECRLTLSMMKSLMSYGADIKRRDESGNTLLHIVTRIKLNDTNDNLLSAVKLLLDNGANFYARDLISHTPLYYACSNGHIDRVKLFIAEGADVNFDNDTKREPMLQVAAEICNLEMFDILLDAGANRHLMADALIQPCFQNHDVMIIRILDTCGVDINMVTNATTGMTILHEACDNSQVSSGTVKVLLGHGADVKAVSATGDTALHYEINNCDCCKIQELLAYNPPLNLPNNWNQTPLVKLMGTTSPRYPLCLNAAWFRVKVLAFKMLVGCGANLTADFEHELNNLRTKHPEIQISDYEISCTRSLQEMCRLVIRGIISVPIDANLCKLPIPKRLHEYLTFPEYIPLVDEYLKISPLQLVA